MNIDNLIDIFIDESRENLQVLNIKLLELEKSPENSDAFNEIFRTAHTLKSMAKAVGLKEISELTHNMENLLEFLKNNNKTTAESAINLFLQCADKLEELIGRTVETGSDQGCEGVNELIENLRREINPGPQSFCAATTGIKPGVSEYAMPEKNMHSHRVPGISGQTARINTKSLDTIAHLIEELIINKTNACRLAEKSGSEELSMAINSIGNISEKLREEVLKLRMMPVGQVFNRFPRFVRDLCKELEKDIIFMTEGSEIKIDRAIAEELSELLVHLIKNSIDHGIETCEERIISGKKAKGTLKLAALKENNNILIKVIDDGKGIDTEKTVKKALEKGLIKEKDICGLTDSEILEFLFAPGFSLCEKTTDLSGRGVGMDMVKSKITSLNGNISISSEKNAGTEVFITLPPEIN